MKILVVDDDEITIDVLTSILSSKGYELVIARDGVELLECLDNTIDLVVTDIAMLHLDGYAAIGIARHHFNLTIPVIAITVISSDLVGNETFNTVLYKPLDIGLLIEAIERLKA